MQEVGVHRDAGCHSSWAMGCRKSGCTDSGMMGYRRLAFMDVRMLGCKWLEHMDAGRRKLGYTAAGAQDVVGVHGHWDVWVHGHQGDGMQEVGVHGCWDAGCRGPWALGWGRSGCTGSELPGQPPPTRPSLPALCLPNPTRARSLLCIHLRPPPRSTPPLPPPPPLRPRGRSAPPLRSAPPHSGARGAVRGRRGGRPHSPNPRPQHSPSAGPTAPAARGPPRIVRGQRQDGGPRTAAPPRAALRPVGMRR